MRHFLALILVAVGLASCATSPSAEVTGSAASGQVLRDAKHMVLLIDTARDRDCQEQRHITVEPMVAEKPGVIVERWHVERCGSTKTYRLTFTPTPTKGGTDVGIQEEP